MLEKENFEFFEQYGKLHMQPQEKPIIVFDLDGTLAETAPDLIQALNEVLIPKGLPETKLSEVRELVGAGMKNLIERVLTKHSILYTEEDLELYFNELLDYYEKHICIHSSLYPGVKDALEQFKNASYTLAVCTNKPEKHSHILLKSLGIHDYFNAICGRDTFSFYKPDPRHLLETILKAGGHSTNAIMVGDSETDIVTAQKANIPVIAFPFGYSLEPVDRYKPTRIINSYDQLYKTVEEIRVLVHSRVIYGP